MKESEQAPPLCPEWDVVYYSDINIVILHRGENGMHAMVPPHSAKPSFLPNWNPQHSVRWLTTHWGYRNNINCSCGHWVKIPPAILERFIATVLTVEKTKC